VVLLLRDGAGRTLLQRRPPSGIWAALWSLPEAADRAAARAWFEAHLAGDYDAGVALDPIQHAFTHYRLRMHPLAWDAVALRDAIRDNDDLRWVAAEDLAALGIPAPVRTLLRSVS
jgi:A/G-specific adenine glycosylase